MKAEFSKYNKTQKKALEDKFYQYYFADEAKSKKIPIKEFYYPLSTLKKEEDEESLKLSLNLEYYERVLKTKKFSDAVKKQLELLHHYYHREIIKKIEGLLLKWDVELQKMGQNCQGKIKELQTYLLENKRCKLPWSLNEVKGAVDRFYSFMNKIIEDN